MRTLVNEQCVIYIKPVQLDGHVMNVVVYDIKNVVNVCDSASMFPLTAICLFLFQAVGNGALEVRDIFFPAVVREFMCVCVF